MIDFIFLDSVDQEQDELEDVGNVLANILMSGSHKSLAKIAQVPHYECVVKKVQLQSFSS